MFSNYRPISVYLFFSKFLETATYKRLNEFLNKNSLLYNYQFGFREAHYTELALLDKIRNTFENNELVLQMFLDLPKAFHTINHNILLGKLEYDRILRMALIWMSNYTHDRS